ncbi:hypothetical protein [Macrococcus equi]|uniref:hypothetical protein n=1 Tax=Macrococcus equi TaxID=3395462 RepID=UPI0039BEC0C9
MKMRFAGIGILMGSLLLASCGNHEVKDEKSNNAKHEGSKEKSQKSKITKDKDSKNKKSDASKNDDTSELPTTESMTTEPVQSTESQNNNVNVTNITDRNVSESVIYGNYSELDKIKAYNSAVANGLIPQGNVMEGPASAAYESSLRIESGQEKSAYRSNPYPNNPNTKKYDYLFRDNQVERTPEEQLEHEDWVNGQIEWSNATDAEKIEIRKREAAANGIEYNPEDYAE